MQPDLTDDEAPMEESSGLVLPAETDAPAGPPPLDRIIEALLFASLGPLTAERGAAAIRGLTAAQFIEAIDRLNSAYRYQGRPYLIQPQGNGFILTLRPRFRAVVENLYAPAREARLSPAAIDVLSLVAYRQPVTKTEIEGIRGSDSGNILRQLVRRGLLSLTESQGSESRQTAYATTPRFLELFKLRSLDDLPQTLDLQKL
jgi:segregation and condensation protein B